MTEAVLFDIQSGVAAITLNRPDRLNALNEDMFNGLRAAFDRIETDETIRAVLLTGAGRGFCAGADLVQSLNGARSETKRDIGATLERDYNPLIRRMRAMPKPIVAAINGVAAGAGVNFALAADIVIAARSASFTQAFIRIGLIPDAGGTYFLPRLVGEARARGLTMLGDTITAAQAEQFGLVYKLLDDEMFHEEALKLAHSLASKPTQALAAIKAALNASAANTLDAQLDLERDTQRRMGYTPDFAEGVAAFIEKRPAKFTGKAE